LVNRILLAIFVFVVTVETGAASSGSSPYRFSLAGPNGPRIEKEATKCCHCLMVGFYGLFRTGEILKLTSQDLGIKKSPRT
jgi:hypothetical protein